jgi:polyketide synthase PksN
VAESDGIVWQPLAQPATMLSRQLSRQPSVNQPSPIPPSQTVSEKLVVQETQAMALPRLEQELARTLAQVLYMEESEVKVEKPFKDMGLDSILSVEWIKSINQQYASNLPASRIYDYPTIRQLASFLQKDLLMRGGAIHQTPAQSLSLLSLDEVLQQVQQRNLDPQKAEQLLRQLSLEKPC